MRQNWQILPHHRRGLCRWVGPPELSSSIWTPGDDAQHHSTSRWNARFSVSRSLSSSRPSTALAQSGSTGGSIGNDDKSLSGSRSAEPERPARRSKPDAEEPRRSSSRRGGGWRAGNFDGAWIVVSTGMTCPGTSTSAVDRDQRQDHRRRPHRNHQPERGRHSVGHYNGVTVVSSGHASGRSGSGTFKGSDGCSGRWVSTKQ